MTPPRPRATPLPGIPDAAVDRWQQLAQAIRCADYTVPCTGPRAALWTSDDHEERTAAAFRCADCLVIGMCSAYAEAAGEKHHVWAGVDRGQRNAKGDNPYQSRSRAPADTLPVSRPSAVLAEVTDC